MKQSAGILRSSFFSLVFLVPVASATAATMPESPSQNGYSVMFVSGGGTADSRARMERMAGDFDLLVTLQSARKDETYNGARVQVTDANGKEILNASPGGPLFYVQVPAGNYTVAAHMNGARLVKTAHVEPHQTTRLKFDLHS